MQVIVVGAGIGGFSAALSLAIAGHEVIILEAASALAEIGAGVQLTPNATKSFWEWGLGPDILENAVLPGSFTIRRDSTGELLGQVSFKDFESRYGGPYIVIHRADIHRILYKHALRAGAQLRLNSKVIKYDFEVGLVQLANGQELRADVIVAVDGINSLARKSFLNEDGDSLEKTGWAAYRTTAPVDAVKSNPQTSHLVAEHNCNCWVGDGKSIMTYMIKNSQVLNIVLSHPDNVNANNWTSQQYKDEIQKLNGNCHPSLKALLAISSPNTQNWPVYQVKPLPRWSSTSGRFVLMGDAAHAMAFYLSMGVSMAVEDAEALSQCISLQQTTKDSLKHAMTVFEQVRKRRTEAVRDASLHAGNMLHLPSGSEQEARDRALKDDGICAAEVETGDFYVTRISYGIADRKIRDWCYGHDVIDEVHKEWAQIDK